MDTGRTFTTGSGAEGKFYSLPALAEQGFPTLAKLPVSIRIVLESVLRCVDGRKVSEKDVANLEIEKQKLKTLGHGLATLLLWSMLMQLMRN